MHPKFGKIARSHSLPKIYKSYEMLPSFRRIADTTNTTCYGLDIYLLPLINSLTHNYYSAKNTFEVVNKIHSIPPELLEQEYCYNSSDVASVFTIVYLNWTIKIIYKRVYRKKLLTTKLGNSTMNKLVEDTCMRTAFSYNKKVYKQII